jgi:glycine dehydrogenase subunit 2
MYLAEVSGMADVSLLPVAGAHSEFVSLLMIKKYFEKKGESRKTILVPDSAHGTNPASSVIAGFEPIKLRSDDRGLIDLNHLEELMNDEVASLMLTVPNTLGLFESRLDEVAKMAHDKGCLVYLDGANMNAFMGILKPGEIGVDIMHFNLHKTFGSPHGTGGPGGGGVGVTSELAPYLPVPRVVKEENRFRLSHNFPDSIGLVHGFYGNFGVSVRAHAYLNALGAEGIREAAENAVLNANYLMSELKDLYDLPYSGPCMHEFVLSGDRQAKLGVRTLDIAKRLLDYGFHPPTIYFPLIVHEALMIEPTETEGLDTLNIFRDAMRRIAEEVKERPDVVTSAPHNTPVRRLDEATAARNLDVNFFARNEAG